MKYLVVAGKPELSKTYGSYAVYRIFQPDVITTTTVTPCRNDFLYIVGESGESNGNIVYVGSKKSEIVRRVEELIYQSFKTNPDSLERYLYIFRSMANIVTNRASEYSYLVLMYEYYLEITKNTKDLIYNMFSEYDKLFNVFNLTYDRKVEFERKGRVEIWGGRTVAIWYGGRDAFLYRYLFEFSDFIVFVNKDEKVCGIMSNKKFNYNDVLAEFERENKDLVKRNAGVLIISDVENEAKLFKKFRQFLEKK